MENKNGNVGYSSEGKGFPNGSVAVLRGKMSWQQGAKKYHKLTPYNKPLEKDARGWLPWLRQEARGN